MAGSHYHGEGEAEPACEPVGMRSQVGRDGFRRLVTIIADLGAVRVDRMIILSYEDMVEFVFGEAVPEIGPVDKMKAFRQRSAEPELLAESAQGCLAGVFARPGMAATGIGP